jgi:hypothetical protein
MAKVKKAKKSKQISRPKHGKQQTKSRTTTKSKNVRPAKVFVYALALAALGGGGYLVYDKMKKKKLSEQNQLPFDKTSDTIIINNSLPVYSSMTSRLVSSGTDSFPLKKGSRGSRVTMLQQALSKTTPSILIDGIFGSQTAGALKIAGYPEVVDETLFNKLIGSGSSNLQIIFNPSTLASSLYKAAQAKNLNEVLNVLRQLKSVSDYSSVNEYYKKQSFISKTIVTDLLEYAFKGNETAKDQIRNEFLRMGLKVSSSGTWSLQGIRLFKDLITIRATVVTDSRNNKIPVRRNTILGDEVEVANGMTWFRSVDNTILKVPTQDVKYT